MSQSLLTSQAGSDCAAAGQPARTAAEIARLSGTITRQGVAKLLLDVPPAHLRIVRGAQEAACWTFAQLPAPLRQRLQDDARRQGYRDATNLWSFPPKRWQPAIPLNQIAPEDLNAAAQLRDVLRPILENTPHLAADRYAQIVQRYGQIFPKPISTDYARKLFNRTLQRDMGARDYTRLELYLPDQPRRKSAPDWSVTDSSLADLLPLLDSRLATVQNVTNPPDIVKQAIWRTAFEEYARLVADDMESKRAAQKIREFLHRRAPFLARSRDALLKAWDFKLSRHLAGDGMPGALVDLRCRNGQRPEIPEADVQRLRWSAATKHSGRLDCAWREEYEHLTEYTRSLGSKFGRCPRSVKTAVNRVLLDGLVARRQGKQTLERMLGTILRDLSGVAATYAWVMDDMTANLEVKEPGREPQLIQFIGVMDVASRRFVGCSMSLDKAPTAELVKEAFIDAVKRTGCIPHHVFLENGWVFGRANQIVGKRNDANEIIIAGLGEYGCEVHHFDPQNPTSKGELEKAFDLLQQRMERHPGYTGRAQRYDAPEEFRREQLAMRRNSNPLDPAKCRYTFDEGVRALLGIVADYNATPQRGHLAGLSPDQAFAAKIDPSNPPICVPAKLHWLLAHRQRVTITHSGVRFTHFGKPIRVGGGELATLERIGREYWAVIDRRDPDCVTFMSLDFTDVFTEPLRPMVSYDQSEHAPDSQALETEYRTKAEHRQLVEDHYQGLVDRFGDPRKELLEQAQAETARLQAAGRLPLVNPTYAAAGIEGERQRQSLRAKPTRKPAAPKSGRSARPGFDEAQKSVFGGNQNSTQPL